MGFVKLELPCPKSSMVVASADPEPLWSVSDLLSEIEVLESRLGCPSSTTGLLHLKQGMDFPVEREMRRRGGEPFVMCISEEDVDGSDSDHDHPDYDQSLRTGTKFSCTDIYLSESEGSDDDDDHDVSLKITPYLVHEKGLTESILSEFEWENELKVKEEVRCGLSALEASQIFEVERSSSAIHQIEKYVEVRRAMDERLDKQYQRKIAEVSDSHLSAIQRDHEQRSQIEERRIRDDAAAEDARKRERALLEEKIRQKKAKAEAEARLKAAKLAEEARKAASEAAIKESKEAAEKEALEKEAARTRAIAADVVQELNVEQENAAPMSGNDMALNAPKGIKVLAAHAALELEASRIKLYDEVVQHMMLSPNEEFERCERRISQHLRQITRIQQKIRNISVALLGIINGPQCPHPISSLLFAQQVVSVSENQGKNFDRTAYAWGHVILLVTSQVPAVMDLLLAALHKACIYTVPKHVQLLTSALKSKDYLKMIGYREEDGHIESSDSYLKRVESCMKLYAVIIQSEIPGVTNPHGLKEGWVWLARFLNKLPANMFTATALKGFLKMAGFSLFRRYRSQFRKILNIISDDFLPALRKSKADNSIIIELEGYLESKAYLTEPEGWYLEGGLTSRNLT